MMVLGAFIVGLGLGAMVGAALCLAALVRVCVVG